MKLSPLHLILIFMILPAMTGVAQETEDPIVISGSTNTTEIFIGDQFTYQLSVEWKEGYELVKVEPPLELGKFEILDVKPESKTDRKSGRLSRTYMYVLSTYDIGEFEIPPFNITYKRPSHEQKTVSSQPIKIHVKPVPHTAEDTRDIRDIKSPKGIPPKPYLRNFLIAVFAGVVLVALAIYLIRRHLRAKKEKKPEVWIPPKPIEELAMEDLDALENSSLLQEGKLKECYSRVSEIIRIYLGRRYGINAIDMTSYELLLALEEHDIEDDVFRAMGDFLEICDLVKFAKHRPGAEVHTTTMEQARYIVKETTPRRPSTIEDTQDEKEMPHAAPRAKAPVVTSDSGKEGSNT